MQTPIFRRDLLLGLGATGLVTGIGCAREPLPPPVVGGAVVPPPPPEPAVSTAKIVYFAQFGVDERMIREALSAALARGGEYADTFFQHKVSRWVRLEDGAVNSAYTNVELGVGVRVVKGDQTGYGYTEDLTLEGIRKAAATAAAIADGPSTPAPGIFHAIDGLPSRYAIRRSWEDVGAAELVPLLRGINDRALAADKRVKRVQTGISAEHGVVLVADSTGRLVEDAQPMTSLYVSCNAEHKGRRETNGKNLAGRADVGLYSVSRVNKLVDDAVALTVILFDAAEAPAGEMPVVMAAGSSGILLHEAIGHGMEADFNRKNTSIYADKIGKPIAKPFVTIVDDGTIDGSRGAINVDDETGVAGKTAMVEGGTLTTYLHDAISAKQYGVKPTGNGRRESYKYPPMPRMRATYMLNGPHKKDEIIASVKRGIYCQQFTNGQVQIGAGDFTFYVKNGWMIEDGKLTHPVKDVNIIGNGPKVLELTDMVADDLAMDDGGWMCGKNGQSVPVSLGIPTVRIAKITVGGSKAS